MLPPQRRRSWAFPVVMALAVLAGVGLALFANREKASPPTLTIEVPNLVVTSDPPGATLRIDESVVGKTPWSGSNAWVGEVKYELSLAGHQPKRGTFTGGRELSLNAKLPKK